MLVLELWCVSILDCANGSLFSFIGPIPERNIERLIITKSYDIFVVCGEIEALDTALMRVEEGPNWGSADTVPNNKHRIVSLITGNNPSFILGASRCRYLITMTLQ